MAQRPVHRFAQTVAVVALERLLGGLEVVVARLDDEADLVKRSLHCKVIDQAQVQRDVAAVVIVTAAGLFIEQHFVVAGDAHKMGV